MLKSLYFKMIIQEVPQKINFNTNKGKSDKNHFHFIKYILKNKNINNHNKLRTLIRKIHSYFLHSDHVNGT